MDTLYTLKEYIKEDWARNARNAQMSKCPKTMPLGKRAKNRKKRAKFEVSLQKPIPLYQRKNRKRKLTKEKDKKESKKWTLYIL